MKITAAVLTLRARTRQNSAAVMSVSAPRAAVGVVSSDLSGMNLNSPSIPGRRIGGHLDSAAHGEVENMAPATKFREQAGNAREGKFSARQNSPRAMSLPIGTQTAGSAHRVLLVDTTQYEPTTPLFLDALREGNAPYRFLDEGPFLRPLDRSIVHKIAYRLAGRRPLTAAALNRALIAASAAFRPTVVVVVKGAYVRPRTLERVKETTGALLINYATDDPFNPVHTTRDLLRGIPHYDLYACTKRAIMADVRQAGCPHAEFVPFGYKPSVHFPEAPSGPEAAAQFSSDVVFIGGLDADRVPYVDALLSIPGISIALYGGYWQRLARTRPFARGFAVGRSYRLALGGAK